MLHTQKGEVTKTVPSRLMIVHTISVKIRGSQKIFMTVPRQNAGDSEAGQWLEDICLRMKNIPIFSSFPTDFGASEVDFNGARP